jgi:hypothetical protein
MTTVRSVGSVASALLSAGLLATSMAGQTPSQSSEPVMGLPLAQAYRDCPRLLEKALSIAQDGSPGFGPYETIQDCRALIGFALTMPGKQRDSLLLVLRRIDADAIKAGEISRGCFINFWGQHPSLLESITTQIGTVWEKQKSLKEPRNLPAESRAKLSNEAQRARLEAQDEIMEFRKCWQPLMKLTQAFPELGPPYWKTEYGYAIAAGADSVLGSWRVPKQLSMILNGAVSKWRLESVLLDRPIPLAQYVRTDLSSSGMLTVTAVKR